MKRLKEITKKNIAKGCLFAAVVLALIILLSGIFTPTYYEWSQDNSSKLVYRVPKNSIQVAFFGTSQVGMGITPMELYENYGICSSLVAGGSQPMDASYYWIREMWRCHAKSLKTVVVDASGLFYDTESGDKVAAAEKSLTGMHLSPNKIQAFMEMEEKYEGVSALDNLIPVFRYHSRWTDLTRDDFTGLLDGRNYFYTMGYTPYYIKSRDNSAQDRIYVRDYSLTDALDSDPSAREASVDPAGREALARIAAFCQDKDLQLVLIKLPKQWSDAQHDALTETGLALDVPVLDLNMPAALDQMEMDFPEDYVDARHPNLYGARKMTGYIGEFLTSRYSYEDIRGNRAYSFMEEYSEEYEKLIADGALTGTTDLTEYLEHLNDEKDRYRIFVAVRGDDAAGLTDEIREQISDLGLASLSELTEDIPYVGLISGGEVLADSEADEYSEGIAVSGLIRDRKTEIIGIEDLWSAAEVQEALADRKADQFRLLSGYADGGALTAAIYVGDKNYADSQDGLHIAVFNREIGCIVDTACFDTHNGSDRIVQKKALHKYTRRISESRLLAAASAEEFVAATGTLSETGDYVTFICDNPGTGTGRFRVVRNGKVIKDVEPKEGETITSPADEVHLLRYRYDTAKGGAAALVIGGVSYPAEIGKTLVLTYDRRFNWEVAHKSFALPQ